MLYFDAGNVISILIVMLSAICIYLAYSITRITSGAPTAWYVIIAAFAVLLITRTVEAYYDVLSPGSGISTDEAVITLIVIVLFVVGLYMLNSTFRKQLRVAQESYERS